MDTIKKKMKWILRHVWELFKMGFPSLVIYSCVGSILMMLTMKGEGVPTWDNNKLLWTVLAWILGMAYNFAASYSQGIIGYDMLASGNMQRRAEDRGNAIKISKYDEIKEYRPWKGFVSGIFAGLIMVIFGLLFGANETAINAVFDDAGENASQSMGILVLCGFLLSGCTLLPTFFLNATGMHISYYVTILALLATIAVSGAAYIAGAYGKRNKVLRMQDKQRAEIEAKQQKQAKINYGGLPGTKPKKHK